MNSLSAVLIVKNEEKRILRYHLENLKSFCNEIIVIVDKLSTDNSYMICKEYTDKVYIHEYKGIDVEEDDCQFVGIKYVTSDWFLLAEADYIFSGPVIKEIQEKIRHDENVAFVIPTVQYVFGKWFINKGTWHWPYTLFKTGKVKFSRSSLHSREYIFDGKTGVFSNPIFHYGVPDIHFFIEKMNKYTTEDAPIFSSRGYGGLFQKTFTDFDPKKLQKEYIDEIKNQLIEKKHYKEGIIGEIYSTLMGFYHYIESAKVYEYRYKESINWSYGNLKDIEEIAEKIYLQLPDSKVILPDYKNKILKIRKQVITITKDLLPPIITRLIRKLY